MTDTAESCEISLLTPHTKPEAGLAEEPQEWRLAGIPVGVAGRSGESIQWLPGAAAKAPGPTSCGQKLAL